MEHSATAATWLDRAENFSFNRGRATSANSIHSSAVAFGVLRDRRRRPAPCAAKIAASKTTVRLVGSAPLALPTAGKRFAGFGEQRRTIAHACHFDFELSAPGNDFAVVFAWARATIISISRSGAVLADSAAPRIRYGTAARRAQMTWPFRDSVLPAGIAWMLLPRVMSLNHNGPLRVDDGSH
jgi:hypothetical protein